MFLLNLRLYFGTEYYIHTKVQVSQRPVIVPCILQQISWLCLCSYYIVCVEVMIMVYPGTDEILYICVTEQDFVSQISLDIHVISMPLHLLQMLNYYTLLLSNHKLSYKSHLLGTWQLWTTRNMTNFCMKLHIW